MKYIVTKKHANLFSLDQKDGTFVARNLKKDGIFVGDLVELDENDAICKVEKRKNVAVRPPISNIDKMFVVAAPLPKPDFFTIDKILLFCFVNKIQPIVCVNKIDLDANFAKKVEKIYKNVAKIITFSSFDQSVQKLKSEISGICVLVGQSAVGKSTIINALKNENVAQVGQFSKKIERGKQTTRVVQLFKFGKNKFLADTAGFSKLDESLLNLKENEVKKFYPDFEKFSQLCKYSSCLHLDGKGAFCGVCDAVEKGKIDENRYKNYQKIVSNIKKLKKY